MAQGSPGYLPLQDLQNALSFAVLQPSSSQYSSEMEVVYGEGMMIVADDITLTAGCNLAFVTAVMSLADAGDKVILYVQTVLLPTNAAEGFIPSAEECAKLITLKTKAIVLVSPNNLTGAIYPPALLASFAKLAHFHNFALILDETYHDFILDLTLHSLFTAPSMLPWRDYLIHLFSFSKLYTIPSFHLGSIAASPAFLKHIETVSLPSTWLISSQGGYYAFIRHLFDGMKSDAVCQQLAEEMGVVSLPNGFFLNLFSVVNVDNEKITCVCESG
ncbi:PLP-dependent transferase [Pleurotus eryngii]|uniref:PLP-dependent transferase n=1 Tax=Pleurotus eryngii TaxID=5323 RepID=A0A9P5ZXD8_PLEER|nr:PLP-dependent transferase [Pleurotus eryngii]